MSPDSPSAPGDDEDGGGYRHLPAAERAILLREGWQADCGPRDDL
jgi:hypothetical protein